MVGGELPEQLLGWEVCLVEMPTPVRRIYVQVVVLRVHYLTKHLPKVTDSDRVDRGRVLFTGF
jgi:hypothetical protein